MSMWLADDEETSETDDEADDRAPFDNAGELFVVVDVPCNFLSRRLASNGSSSCAIKTPFEFDLRSSMTTPGALPKS